MATDTTFNVQIVKTLAFEGGYGNDPDDPGGETNFGISKAAYPDLDIKSLTQDGAIAIYKRDYWFDPGISQLPDAIAGKVFDMGVNMGPTTAIRIWQQVLNSWMDFGLACDGRIGPITAAASMTACAKNPALSLTNYRAALAEHYLEIIRNNPSLGKFKNGWLRRAQA